MAARTLLLSALLALPGASAHGAEDAARVVSTPEAREAVSVTVYNQDFALVREVRSLDLPRGRVELELAGVAATIEPETVAIRSLAGGEALRILEQNYRYDLLSPQKLLEKYVGRQVKLYRWNEATGRDEVVTAEVLAVNEGTVLRIGDEITFGFPGRIAFPEVPENLIARPTLVWLLESGAREQRVETSYLAGQLDWKADYVLLVDADDTRGDLAGWVTLTNQSGASYEDATLQLVAGDVQRLRDVVPESRMVETLARAAADESFREEAFFEYHLYTLERPTTLRDREQKQVRLLEADGVALEKRFVLESRPHWFRSRFGEVESKRKVSVVLQLENREALGLGMPLPMGVVRVYKADAKGGRQFVGEDHIDHTPRDETIELQVGQAFDVVADRRQMEWRSLGECSAESAWEIEIRNHKDEAVRVEVVEPVTGDWEILSASHSHERRDANTFVFRPEVPARGRVTVEYRVRVRWC